VMAHDKKLSICLWGSVGLFRHSVTQRQC
jgi:hypothetical protein